MNKLSTFVAVLTLVIAIPMIHGLVDQSPEAVEEWVDGLNYKKEEVTKLHFYLHESASGANETGFLVAESNLTTTSPTLFSKVWIIDDILKEGSDHDSATIGRAQGLVASASLSETSLLMNVNLVFTSGNYSGSTLCLQGWNSIPLTYREMSIVGGSGVFRLARGIATGKTFSWNGPNIVVDYHVVVIHY